MRKAVFIPEAKSIASLLTVFKKEKQSFAIIVNEHGSNQGIITKDDILKAVFGRITDEHNMEKKPEERIQIVKTNQFLIPGDIKIDDFNRIFKQNIHSDSFETLGGYLLEEFGYLPNTGEFLKRKNCVFAVELQNQRRIKRIRFTIL